MAILDTLFGGSSQAELLGGLLGEDKLNQLRSQATQTGLINAAIGYLAQPKNQRFGSALPYLARAFTAGQQGAQGVYDDALRNYATQQKMTEMQWQQEQRKMDRERELAQRTARERVLPELLGMPSAYRGTTEEVIPGAEYSTPTGNVESPFTAQFQTQRMPDTTRQVPTFNEQEYMKDLVTSGLGEKVLETRMAREKKVPFGQVDVSKFTPESVRKFESSGIYSDLDPIEREAKLPVSAQEYEMAKKDPEYRKFLNQKWLANFYATQPYRQSELEMQQQEQQYKYGTPQAPMPSSVTMQDVSDTAKATGKTTQQVINDLKARGINVRSK
jgi:hypothetical protein